MKSPYCAYDRGPIGTTVTGHGMMDDQIGRRRVTETVGIITIIASTPYFATDNGGTGIATN